MTTSGPSAATPCQFSPSYAPTTASSYGALLVPRRIVTSFSAIIVIVEVMSLPSATRSSDAFLHSQQHAPTIAPMPNTALPTSLDVASPPTTDMPFLMTMARLA